MIDIVAFNALVAETVRKELDRALGARRPLSKTELAAALGKSTATVDRYVRKGMPFLRVGARRSFELDACRAWLGNGPTDGAVVKQEDVLTMGVVRKTRKEA